MTLTVGAVVHLDFPARDAYLLTTSRQIYGGSTWTDEMVPAVLASLVGDAKFGNAHDVALGDVEIECVDEVLLLIAKMMLQRWRT